MVPVVLPNVVMVPFVEFRVVMVPFVAVRLDVDMLVVVIESAVMSDNPVMLISLMELIPVIEVI